MNYYKQMVLRYGKVLPNNILLLDSIINHQVDSVLMLKIGEDFKKMAEMEKITKIVTIESSGIAPALMTSLVMKLPLVFAKKYSEKTKKEDFYMNSVHSYTKDITFNVGIKKEFISPSDNILIIDDFLARGHSMIGLINIIKKSKANIKLIGIIIEKIFQNGGKELKKRGYKYKSLVKIKSLKNNKVVFED